MLNFLKKETMESTVYNTDCIQGMKEYPDKYFDLAIVDPPYGIGVNSMNMGGRKTIRPDKREWDNEIPSEEYFIELFRVSKERIIWGGNYFPLPPNKCFIIWDKGETMYGRDFADCEFAWASMDKPARLFKKSPNQLDRIHPTQKPISLYEFLLKKYANKGDKILDTHLGSGTHRCAAYALGYDFTGFELDMDYYDAQEKRFEAFKADLDARDSMFAPLVTAKQESLFDDLKKSA